MVNVSMNFFALPPCNFPEFERTKVIYYFVHHGEDDVVKNSKRPRVHWHDINNSLLVDTKAIQIPESIMQGANGSSIHRTARIRDGDVLQICQNQKNC